MILKYLNTPAAAEYLQVSRQLLERWRMQRTGPIYCKVGAAVRYAISDLDAWMEKHRVRPYGAAEHGPWK